MDSFWSVLLPVLITATIAVGGGGVAIWKFLQQQELIHKKDDDEREAQLNAAEQKAKDATWKRATDIMNRDQESIARLKKERDDCLDKLKGE